MQTNDKRTYNSWNAMRQRCTNPTSGNFERYGGRGITFCERWRVFADFVADMGIRPEGTSLERIDNNGNYEPTNCCWAGLEEQGRNGRHNRLITVRGVTRCLVEWSLISEVERALISIRIARGWTPEEAIELIPHKSKRNHMPNLNIPISEELLREVNLCAVRTGKKQKEWIIDLLKIVTSGPSDDPDIQALLTPK